VTKQQKKMSLMKQNKLKLIITSIGFFFVYSNTYAGEIDSILGGFFELLWGLFFTIVGVITMFVIFRKDSKFINFTLINLMTFFVVLFLIMGMGSNPSINILLICIPILAQFIAIVMAISRKIKGGRNKK